MAGHVPQPVSRPRGEAPEIGAAFRARLAAQADAAFASTNDHALKQHLQDPDSRAGTRAQGVAAANLLLPRDPIPEGPTEEQVDQAALRRAAETGDVNALAKMDRRLRRLLAEDEELRGLLKEGAAPPTDPRAMAALQLYRDSFMSLEAQGRDCERDAFSAVMRDDAELLRTLLDKGLRPQGLKNGGGDTLLSLARERGKASCVEVLLQAGLTQ